MALRLLIRSAPETLGATTSVVLPTAEEIAYSFDQERVVIGRGPGADVRLPHRSVSTQHALLSSVGEQHNIVDCSSTNGTHVNGQRVSSDRPKTLHEGDLITVGGYIFAFHAGRTTAAIVTAERTAELAKHMLRSQRGSHAANVSSPRLVVLNGPNTGASLSVPEPPVRLLVGRGEACQLQLSDAKVSREHMEVTRDLEGVVVRNLDSENGVRWGELAVFERRLRDGDELTLGATRLLFEDPAEELMKSLAAEPDMRVEVPALPPPPVPETEPEAVVVSAPVAVPVKRRSSGGPSFADLVIYAFAGAVLVLSVAGILTLLRAQ